MTRYIYRNLNMNKHHKKRLKLLAITEVVVFTMLFVGIMFMIYVRLFP